MLDVGGGSRRLLRAKIDKPRVLDTRKAGTVHMRAGYNLNLNMIRDESKLQPWQRMHYNGRLGYIPFATFCVHSRIWCNG